MPQGSTWHKPEGACNRVRAHRKLPLAEHHSRLQILTLPAMSGTCTLNAQELDTAFSSGSKCQMSTCTHFLKSCSELVFQPLNAHRRGGERLFRRDLDFSEKVYNTRPFSGSPLLAGTPSKVRQRDVLISRDRSLSAGTLLSTGEMADYQILPFIHQLHQKSILLPQSPCRRDETDRKALTNRSQAEEMSFGAITDTPAMPRGCGAIRTFGAGQRRRETAQLRPWRLNTVQFLL